MNNVDGRNDGAEGRLSREVKLNLGAGQNAEKASHPLHDTPWDLGITLALLTGGKRRERLAVVGHEIVVNSVRTEHVSRGTSLKHLPDFPQRDRTEG
jgi:hypothetical protein